jgi:hypothetical protein
LVGKRKEVKTFKLQGLRALSWKDFGERLRAFERITSFLNYSNDSNARYARVVYQFERQKEKLRDGLCEAKQPPPGLTLE